MNEILQIFQKWRGLITRSLPASRELKVLPLASAMALLLFLLFHDIDWILLLPIKILIIAGLLSPSLRSLPHLWLALTLLLGLGITFEWTTKENHQYVFVYIALLFFSAYHSPEETRARVLATGAPLLISLAMLTSVVWKLLTPDYLTGEFFLYSLLTNPYLTDMALATGSVTEEMLLANQQAERLMITDYFTTDQFSTVPIAGTPAAMTMARVITFWTIGIEALIGLLFLAPRRLLQRVPWLDRGRHLVLILFIITTYPFATVIGFGWSFAILALAACAEKPSYFRPIYVFLFFYILFTGFVPIL